MRIIQITDLHIGREGEDTFGIDVRGNFLRVLAAVRDLQPDLLVVSGDLCYRDGERDIYDWVKRQLDALGIPCELMSGNHDDPALLAAAFQLQGDLHGGELYYARQIEGHTILFLDTTTGVLSPAQQKWLRASLQTQPGVALLFMHHPPVLGGVPHMDRNYPLGNRDQVQEILFAYSRPLYVFAGHYHVEKVVQKGNLTVFLTPSCFFQIDQRQVEFAVDHRRPALREITWNDGVLMTTVKYLEE